MRAQALAQRERAAKMREHALVVSSMLRRFADETWQGMSRARRRLRASRRGPGNGM
jgi:hypothetical protein